VVDEEPHRDEDQRKAQIAPISAPASERPGRREQIERVSVAPLPPAGCGRRTRTGQLADLGRPPATVVERVVSFGEQPCLTHAAVGA
jgi:hypothetical protein